LPVLNLRARIFVGSILAARSSCVGGSVIHSSRCAFFGASVNCGSVSNADFPVALSKPEDAPPGGGGAGPKSSSLLSESLSGGLGGRSSRGAGGGAGPTMRAGFEDGGGAGPTSLSTLLDRDVACGGSEGPAVRGGEDAEGGGAGPMTRLRLSPDSGLDARLSSSSRLRLERCGGMVGPIDDIVGVGCEWKVYLTARRVTFYGAWTFTNGAAHAAICELRHELRRRAILASPCQPSWAPFTLSTNLHTRRIRPRLSRYPPGRTPNSPSRRQHRPVPSPKPPRRVDYTRGLQHLEDQIPDIARLSTATRCAPEAMPCAERA